MTSTDMVVREGTDVTLVCQASGYPEPYVMWRREDGQDFNYNGESGKTLTCSVRLYINEIVINNIIKKWQTKRFK